VPGFEQRFGGCRTDITSAAGDKDIHNLSL
jgi:hypothetical protein